MNLSRTVRRIYLGFVAAACIAFLTAFFTGEQREAVRPTELDGLARWTTDHPADYLAASLLTDQALDANAPKRFELWRGAYAHATQLAPLRTNPAAAFTRAGLFHWYELDTNDRRAVLQAAAPLLRDPATFQRMHRPLWELTGDFAYLRRNAPDDERALLELRDIAVTNGRFADYREVRDALVRRRMQTFTAERTTLAPPDLVGLLPQRMTTAYEPLLRGVLDELQRRPLDAGNAARTVGQAEELIAYALRHDVRPLDGLEAIIETPPIRPSIRARLAIALGHDRQAAAIELAHATHSAEWAPYFRERAAFEDARGNRALSSLYRQRVIEAEPLQWTGLCSRDEVCVTATRVVNAPAAIKLQNAQSDEVPPYVEIYADDALVAEGAIEDAKTFEVGKGRIELRLVNPLTRNRFQRRVRLS